jgi:hypothetical protein
MEYVRRSGGGAERDSRSGGAQASSEIDGISVSNEYFNNGEDVDSDDYSYDSESDDEL